jgi:hypothetical protein
MVIGGLKSLASEVEERAQQTQLDTAEPIEKFMNNYTN